METDGANQATAWYVHGHGLLWKVAADGNPYFYHFDGEGNVVAVSTPAGGVVNRYRYDPTGRLSAAEEQVENPFRARGEAGWIDDGNDVIYGDGVYHLPELKVAVNGSVSIAPPEPSLTPPLDPTTACFLRGLGCAAGRAK
jgi:YD repeat-containing protein